MISDLNSGTHAVLIVGYRRFENLATLLNLSIERNVSQIYVALDGPRTRGESIETEKCKQVVADFKTKYPGRITERVSEKNQGAAYSVLMAVGWAFESEEFLTILEDDCIPSNEFFDFIEQGKFFLSSDQNCFLICGTQFAPAQVTHSQWSLSSYPLIWGWATSKPKWNQLLELLQAYEPKTRIKGRASLAERLFWGAGARRSYQGFVDAWDLPLVHAMRKVNGLALLPGENFITNIGNDGYATHTKSPSRWLNKEFGKLETGNTQPNRNWELDEWLRRNFYQIRFKHIFTTRLTWLLDLIGIHKRIRAPLLKRINNN